MEASKRNTNRTKDRNEIPFKNLTDRLEMLKTMSFFYQYCNNPKCKEFTLFVLASSQKMDKSTQQAFITTAEKSHIPGLILEYTEDKIQARCVGKGVNKTLKDQSWDDILNLMYSQQLKHEKHNQDCANYTHTFLEKGTWNNKNLDTRFSNEIRSIPGVRHIDVDGLLYCPDCYETLYVVEATSDGTPNTPLAFKFKATTMTRKMAKTLEAKPLLIQHHYQDEEHKNPVYLTVWNETGSKQYKRTWKTLEKDFHKSYQNHKEQECQKQTRKK